MSVNLDQLGLDRLLKHSAVQLLSRRLCLHLNTSTAWLFNTTCQQLGTSSARHRRTHFGVRRARFEVTVVGKDQFCGTAVGRDPLSRLAGTHFEVERVYFGVTAIGREPFWSTHRNLNTLSSLYLTTRSSILQNVKVRQKDLTSLRFILQLLDVVWGLGGLHILILPPTQTCIYRWLILQLCAE